MRLENLNQKKQCEIFITYLKFDFKIIRSESVPRQINEFARELRSQNNGPRKIPACIRVILFLKIRIIRQSLWRMDDAKNLRLWDGDSRRRTDTRLGISRQFAMFVLSQPQEREGIAHPGVSRFVILAVAFVTILTSRLVDPIVFSFLFLQS